MRVLLVEDDETHAEPLNRELQGAGWEVTVARTGERGLELLRAAAFDLVVADHVLPGMSGLQLLAAARQTRSDVPVIMLTGAGNEELVRLALKSGAADYLMKDARLEYVRHLPQALAAAVSAWQAQRAAERQQSDLERLTAELDALANRDSLTGLWNRRYLDATLRHEIERTRRYARPLACLMVDLDGFKGINDTHGHLAGDRVLAAVARTLSDALRVSDYCCRFGGDEFVIVAPETDLNGAVVLARRVSQAVSEAAVREGSVCLQVTASIGVATFTGAPDVGGEALLQAADQALLVAKSHGPGRVATDREVRRGAAA